MKPEKTYEVRIPVKETWVFTVKAKSKKEAIAKVYSNDDSVEQTCSLGGWPKGKNAMESFKPLATEVKK